jgi:hypothetical protein
VAAEGEALGTASTLPAPSTNALKAENSTLAVA